MTQEDNPKERTKLKWETIEPDEKGEFTNILLTKIESNHNNVRTKTMEGETRRLPQVARSFLIFAKGGGLKIKGSDRMIHTTQVREIRLFDDFTIIFKTRNSTYKLERYAQD